MNSEEFINYFNKITETDEDKLDKLYNDYIEYVNILKNKGYKVMRNKKGEHKIEKCK